METQTCRIVSFDIGKKNFAQYVEDFSLHELINLRQEYLKIPKEKRKKIRNPLGSESANILNKIYLGGKRIQTGVYDLRHDRSSNELDLKTRINILQHLERFFDLWETCNIIVIEQQYFKTTGRSGKRGKGTEANVDAIKIGELVLTWFLTTFMFKEIRYFGSQFKTQILGAPLGLNDSQRKRWAKNKAEEIYVMRDDRDALSLWKLERLVYRKRIGENEDKIQHYLSQFEGTGNDVKEMASKIVRDRQKLDDIGDACIQCQAYKFREFILEM